MYNDLFLLISLKSPTLYRNLQLASRSFWLYLRSLSSLKREEIRSSFIQYKFGETTLSPVQITQRSKYGVNPSGQREGLCEMYYTDGTLASQHYYWNGKLEGKFIYWHANKNIRAVGYYCDGKLVGDWVNYHLDGSLWNIITYVDGKEEGTAYYWRDGCFSHLINYHKGVIHGIKEQFGGPNYYSRLRYVNGILEGIAEVWFDQRYKKSFFVNGRRDSEEGWTSEGILRYRVTFEVPREDFNTIDYDRWPLLNGTVETFHPNGGRESLKYYINYKLNKLCKKWNPKGILVFRGNYQRNRYHGTVERWTDRGKLSGKWIYLEGRLVESFYPNGSIRTKINYRDNFKEGWSQTWYLDGSLASRVNYLNNLREGLTESWYPDGKIRNCSMYRKGILDGPFESWYSNGQIASRGQNFKGCRTYFQSWNPDGSLNLNPKKIIKK